MVQFDSKRTQSRGNSKLLIQTDKSMHFKSKFSTLSTVASSSLSAQISEYNESHT